MVVIGGYSGLLVKCRGYVQILVPLLECLDVYSGFGGIIRVGECIEQRCEAIGAFVSIICKGIHLFVLNFIGC